MTRFGYKTASAAAILVPVALLAAGCSSGKNGGGAYGGGRAATGTAASGGAATTATTAGAGSSSAQGATRRSATAVTATEQEFSIALSAKTFKAGTYTFTVHNAGKFPHNLTIEGPGVDKIASPTLPGGSTGNVSLTLRKGSYELWCSVDSHKDKGMELHIVVS
jgi:uncharacterized cupredoxin-like copper-binding protein